jgi:hypothetical protein
MHPRCPACGAKFEREAGFYLGSIYFNYGLTALIAAIAYPLLRFNRVLPNEVLMPLTVGFAIVFPIWFFRYARALWLGFDQYWDPRRGEEETGLQGPAGNHPGGDGSQGEPGREEKNRDGVAGRP